MSTDALEQAITLIKEGNILDAQKILEEILSADPHNLSAWGWYVRTYPKGEKRIKALELCLKYNPENEQVKEALKRLQMSTEQKNKPGFVLIGSLSAILTAVFSVVLFAIITIVAQYAIYGIGAFAILWVMGMHPSH